MLRNRSTLVCVSLIAGVIGVSGCTASVESDAEGTIPTGAESAEPNPPVADEDSTWAQVQLAFTNRTDRDLKLDAIVNCTEKQSQNLPVGGTATLPASTCPGGPGIHDVYQGSIYSGDSWNRMDKTGFSFDADNPAIGDVWFSTSLRSGADDRWKFTQNQTDPSQKCVWGDYIVVNTGYDTISDDTDSEVRKLSFAVYSDATASSAGRASC